MNLKHLCLIIVAGVILTACSSNVNSDHQTLPDVRDYKLWYQQPATSWNDALPVGNGRLGAMVFGNVYNERIQVNEESLWAGKRIITNNPEALAALPEIRRLIFEGKINEAYRLGNQSLLGTPPRFRSYQTLGDITLSIDACSFTWAPNKSGYDFFRASDRISSQTSWG